jgi:hypothetical protein
VTLSPRTNASQTSPFSDTKGCTLTSTFEAVALGVMSETRAGAFAAVPSLHFFEGASRLARLLWADGANAGTAADDAAVGEGSPGDAESIVAETSCGVGWGGGGGDCDV